MPRCFIINRSFSFKKIRIKKNYIFILYYYSVVLIIINLENGTKNTNPINNIVYTFANE